MEGLLWKTCLYSSTTLNESYMHWMGIMLPKWSHNTKETYLIKEAAAFIIFISKQEKKVYVAKKLQKNKYAATVIAALKAKLFMYEPAILQAIKVLCFSDNVTLDAVVDREKANFKVKEKRESVQTLRMKADSKDTLTRNIGMTSTTPAKYKGGHYDGIVCSEQKAEQEESARPCPPFPFIKEQLLLDDVSKQRLMDVWNVTNSLKKKFTTTESNEKIKYEGDHDDVCSECEKESITPLPCYFCKKILCEQCNENDNECWSQVSIEEVDDHILIYSCKECLT